MITLSLYPWQITFLVFIIGIIFFAIWRILYSNRLHREHLMRDTESLKEQKQEVLLRMTKAEYKNETLYNENNEIKQKLQRSEYLQEQREKDFYEKTSQLETARVHLLEEREKEKIIKEIDQQNIEKNRTREWNEHEIKTISVLENSCSNPLSSFVSYTNTQLPNVFPSDIKPDFCISFGDQYIIFDAKKSKNIQQYITDQGKKTVEKYRSISSISSILFFVVPESQIYEIKTPVVTENGYTIYTIAPSHIPQSLMMIKKLEYYQEISEFSADDQEHIIYLLSKYEQHITAQNATNIILAQKSFEIEEEKSRLSQDIRSQINDQKNVLNPIKITPQALAKYSFPTERQKKWIFDKSAPSINPKLSVLSR